MTEKNYCVDFKIQTKHTKKQEKNIIWLKRQTKKSFKFYPKKTMICIIIIFKDKKETEIFMQSI